MSSGVKHWQIVARDPDKVAKFYGELFGWRISQKNAMGYRQVETGNGVGGGIWPAPPEAQSFVQLFFGVSNVDQSVERAKELGAKLVIPPSTLPDGDRMAVLTDPAGVPFGLMQQR